MLDPSKPIESLHFHARLMLQSVIRVQASRSASLAASALIFFLSLPVCAQQSDPKSPPVVVRPGAPGQPTRTLPTSTMATLPPLSRKDVEFMQGMIMHHAQAVEMTALIEPRIDNKELRLLGARISHSQAEEMRFMKRWLEARGEPVSMPLGNAKGKEFDRLFLAGMIQHHIGALVMVKDLFDTVGAGQDAELFNFATDVDSSQRAEISIMRNMLGEKPVKEKL